MTYIDTSKLRFKEKDCLSQLQAIPFDFSVDYHRAIENAVNQADTFGFRKLLESLASEVISNPHQLRKAIGQKAFQSIASLNTVTVLLSMKILIACEQSQVVTEQFICLAMML
jgi:hypothetical protein